MKPKAEQKTFFCLAVSQQGTTAAMIKAKSIRQAHLIYTTKVIVPARPKPIDRFQPDALKKDGLIYWNGHYYIEQLKVWKKIKGCPIATISALIYVVGNNPKKRPKISYGEKQYDNDINI